MACMLVEAVARGPEFGRRFTSGGWISGSICGTQSPGRYVLAVMAAGRQAGERRSTGTPRPPGCAGGLLPRGGLGNAAGHRVLSASWVGLTGQLGNPAHAGAGTRPTGSPLCCSKPPGAPKPLAPPCAATAGPRPGDWAGGSASPGLSPGTRSSTAGLRTTLGRQPSGRNAASLVASMPRRDGPPAALFRRPAVISFTRPWDCPQLSWKSLAWTRSTGSAHRRWHASAHHRGLGEGRAAALAGRADGQQESGPGAVRVGTRAVRGKRLPPSREGETKGTT
jgi:hypothetical protein